MLWIFLAWLCLHEYVYSNCIMTSLHLKCNSNSGMIWNLTPIFHPFRSREEKGSHDLCWRCGVPAGLPHPGRWRGPWGPAVHRWHQWRLHIVLAGPAAQLGGRQEPGGPEQHSQGGHRAATRCPHGPPEEQVLQQPRQPVAGLGHCRAAGIMTHTTPH